METEIKLHVFSILREQKLEELQAVLHHLRHEKTGLEVVWLEREEENKTFGIAFQTIPEDNTGVFHILEHSVLCGSDRYPVKEPFVELLKHSMNTFLNAMTFPDKTFYPVSSRNEKDFLNLMRIYLDAVFCPLIYSRQAIFQQEGWHYEFDQEGRPGYKGVVFNEMKGAYADVDQLAARAVSQALFPDTCYRFESGGDPAHIPDLAYEQFLDSHRRCYSPSNAYVFLDGAVELETVLAILDGEYLSGMERGERLSPPAMQAPVRAETRQVEFELPPEESGDKRCRLVWGSVVGAYDQREKLTAMRVLASVLCGDNQAPLCRAVLSRGLAESVTLQVSDEVSQPWIQLEARNLAREDMDQVERVLFDELERLAREGLDRRRLESALANLEFQMRERDYGFYPQGLMFGFQVLDSWMRGGRPEANLEVGGLFDALREKMEQGYFEDLIREVLLERPHSCKVELLPSRTAGEERRQAEADRLAREAAAWSEADRQALLAQQRALEDWQNSADTPEQLAALPHLERSDLSREPVALPTRMDAVDGVPLLRHEVPASGVVYLNLYFDAEGYAEEELSCLSLLCRLLGRVDTREHTAEELGIRMRLLCGSMSCYVSSYEVFRQPGTCRTKLCVCFSTLEHNLDSALELVGELLTQSRFEQEREIQDVLKQNKMKMFQQIVMSGNSIALGRVAAQTCAASVAQEYAGGFAYYQWLKGWEEQWDWPRLKEMLSGLYRRVFGRGGLTVSVTGTPRQDAAPSLARLLQRLPQRTAQSGGETGLKPWGRRLEGIEIPADVSFACLGGALGASDGAWSGTWNLAAKVVGLSYLWNAIRVQGGAYGTGLYLRDLSFAGCYSYRDPNAARSLDCYRQAAAFLREFCAGKPDLTGFIIGAVSDGEPLMTPRMKGMTADSQYWRDLSWEQRCRLRRELLEAGPEQLAGLADALERVMNGGGVCVIGPRGQLDQCGLDEILSV